MSIVQCLLTLTAHLPSNTVLFSSQCLVQQSKSTEGNCNSNYYRHLKYMTPNTLLTLVTSQAVAQTCCISKCAKYRKSYLITVANQ